MYERSLTQSVNEAVLDLCRKSGWESVRHIVLKVGGMRKADPELMASLFSVISRGGPAEGADLSTLALPIVFRCGKCGDVESESAEFACPVCGSHDVELLSGLQLGIELIEIG